MKLATFTPAADFLDAAQASLEAQEVVNSLMLGLALGLAAHPDRIQDPPYFAVVEGDGGLVAAALMTPPHHVLVQAFGPDPSAALAPVARDLARRCPSLTGVRGPAAVSTAFAKAWAAQTGAAHQIGMRTRAFELRAVTPPGWPPGRLRQATRGDVPLLTDWLPQFHREAVASEPTADFGQIARRRVEAGDMFFWEDGNQPVTMAARARPTRRGVTINAVYTPPALRRRGYATACTAALSQRLLDEGFAFCTLFTDLANPTSNKIYQQIGYRPVCDFEEYRFFAAGGA